MPPAPPARNLRRAWLAAGCGLVGLVIWLSLREVGPEGGISGSDKVGHLLAYATLQWWFCQLRAETPSRLLLAAGFAALGVALEFAQEATGYRSFEYGDMAANTLGVLAGWIASPPRTQSLLDAIVRRAHR